MGGKDRGIVRKVSADGRLLEYIWTHDIQSAIRGDDEDTVAAGEVVVVVIG